MVEKSFMNGCGYAQQIWRGRKKSKREHWYYLLAIAFLIVTITSLDSYRNLTWSVGFMPDSIERIYFY